MEINWNTIDYDNGLAVKFKATVNGVEYRNFARIHPDMSTIQLATEFDRVHSWLQNIAGKEDVVNQTNNGRGM